MIQARNHDIIHSNLLELYRVILHRFGSVFETVLEQGQEFKSPCRSKFLPYDPPWYNLWDLPWRLFPRLCFKIKRKRNSLRVVWFKESDSFWKVCFFYLVRTQIFPQNAQWVAIVRDLYGNLGVRGSIFRMIKCGKSTDSSLLPLRQVEQEWFGSQLGSLTKEGPSHASGWRLQPITKRHHKRPLSQHGNYNQ